MEPQNISFNNIMQELVGQQMRMEHARLLMLEGSLTVSEAADALGYANPQHFSTAYKKQFGLNPGKLVPGSKLSIYLF